MNIVRICALATAVAVVVSPPGFAAGDRSPQQAEARGDHSTTGQQTKQAASSKAAVVGEVIDSRNVTISSSAGNQHKLYKLRTPDGKIVILDVGQVEQEPAELQQGDIAMAIGSKARINGDPVLFARYYGESHAAGRNVPERDRQ